MMRRAILVAIGLVIWAGTAWAADPLAEARRLYNAGRYDAAAQAAQDAMAVAGQADAARVVLGRIQLERFRQTSDPADLTAARQSLRSVDSKFLTYSERLELTIGQAEVLYLDQRFGAAAELFEQSLDRSVILGPAAHVRVLDWWATALDRHAQQAPAEHRGAVYARIMERMAAEMSLDSGSTAASYWMVAAARGSGDLERAWQAAIAGWVRASLSADGAEVLRADLDRLVTQVIIPERAARLHPANPPDAASVMETDWATFKAEWNK
jgi:hypothetical protein